MPLKTGQTSPMHLFLGDITRLKVDAMVNAANPTLTGGGGVDGAIHRAAGPLLLAACRRLQGCEPGQTKATSAYELPASWVLHTVGPVWQGGEKRERELLASCYRTSLELAVEKSAKSISFPAVSTGAYGFPMEEASLIAVRSVVGFLESTKVDLEVFFVCYDEAQWEEYFNNLSAFTSV